MTCRHVIRNTDPQKVLDVYNILYTGGFRGSALITEDWLWFSLWFGSGVHCRPASVDVDVEV